MTAPREPTHLSIRNLPREVARALHAERQRRGVSLNQAVLDVLARGLGLDRPRPGTNGLERLAGGWTEEEYQRFEDAVRPFEQIDEELWR